MNMAMPSDLRDRPTPHHRLRAGTLRRVPAGSPWSAAAVLLAVHAGIAMPSTTVHAQDAPQAGPAATATTTPRGTGADSIADRRDRNRAAAEEALARSAVPSPMDEARFLRLLRETDATLESNRELLEGHARYLGSIERQTRTAARQIQRLLAASYRFDAAREAFVPRPTPELIALLSLRDRSLRTIESEEQTLLDAVSGAVDAAHRPAFARALLAWRLEQLPTENRLPSTRITVLDGLARVRLDEATAAAIEPVVTEYATALAKAFAERSRRVAESEAARAITETTAGLLWRYAPEDSRAAIETSLAAIDDAEFATEVAIRDIQFNAVEKLRTRLQPRDGRRLVESWQRAMHPELFDDERLLSRIVEETLAHPAFDDDQDTALLDALESCYQRLEPLSRAACEAADLVVPRALTGGPDAMVAEIDARLAVIDAQLKRRGPIRDAMQRARIMLGDSDAELTGRIEDAIYTIDSLNRADQFDQRALAARRDAIDLAAPSVQLDANLPADQAGATTGSDPSNNSAPASGATGSAGSAGSEPSRQIRGGRGGRRGSGTR